MTSPVDIRPDHLEIVQDILIKNLPAGVKVWVFGSRANWTTKDSSDLDLALEGEGKLSHTVLGALKDAFEDSSLPYTVDVVDFNRIGDAFKQIVELQRTPLPLDRVVHYGADLTGTSGEWCEITLGDLIHIRHGYAFKGQFINDEQHGDILLTPGNFVIGGGFKFDKLKYYNGPIPEEYVLEENDLLVTMTDLSKQSDTLGYPAFVPVSQDGRRFLHNQRLGKVVFKSDPETDARFLYFLLCSAEYRHEVLASSTGTTVKHTSPNRIRKFRFHLPPLPEQRAIAHILGTLDDKIELNRRMNETLEAIARALFKSWFVDFDPVRAKMDGRDTGLPPHIAALFPDRLVPSELGKIPEGWEMGAVGDYFHLTMGQSPPGSTYNDIGNGLPFFQGRTDFGFRYPKNRKFCTEPKRLAQAEDTLVSVRAPVGDINRAWETSCIGRGVAALRHRSLSSSYTYYSAMELQKVIEQFEHTGTVFGSIKKSQFANLQVIEPSTELVNAWNDYISPQDERIRTNSAEATILADLRDTLLPKLMSGEVKV